GIMIVPPLVALLGSQQPLLRPWLVTAVLFLALSATAIAAYVAPAYTSEQPLRRQVRAVQDGDGAQAIWEVASVEPGLDLGPGAPSGWTPQSAAAPATVPWGTLPYPFVFRTTGPALGPAPVDIAAFAVRPVQAGTEVDVTAVPKRPGIAVSFVLPAGLTP